jgi:Xanthosine triphosphate pyrophosphatase
MLSLTTIVLATNNAHKVGEIRAILGEQFQFRTLGDFPNPPKVVEDAPTFAGNATKKAVELAKYLSAGAYEPWTYVLADDSGLEVDALNGAPGVHSARFAAMDRGAQGNSSDAENRAKLLRLLKDVPMEKRGARFRCVLALTPLGKMENPGASPVCYADDFEMETELFEGSCEGRIEFSERGQGGFGYDSLFTPSGYSQTFGELTEDVKNRLSHRARALEKLKLRFRERAPQSP